MSITLPLLLFYNTFFIESKINFIHCSQCKTLDLQDLYPMDRRVFITGSQEIHFDLIIPNSEYVKL